MRPALAQSLFLIANAVASMPAEALSGPQLVALRCDPGGWRASLLLLVLAATETPAARLRSVDWREGRLPLWACHDLQGAQEGQNTAWQ